MRRISRTTGVLLVLVLLAAACSKPKNDDEGSLQAGANDTPQFDDQVVADPTDGPSTTLAPGQQPAGQNATAGGGPSGTTPRATQAAGADVNQAKAVGALVKPQSSEKVDTSWAGVTKDTIKLIFSIDETSCGVNVVNALTAAGGALPSAKRYYRAAPTTQDRVTAETRESVDLMVKYWNDHAGDTVEFFPEIQKVQAKYNSPGHLFYGRKLTHEIIDGGSNQCPDKTTAAAKLAIEKNAFTVYNNLEGASPAGAYNMAAALNAQPANKRPMNFGTLWLSDKEYDRFAPYTWTQFATGTTITRSWASWVCSRLLTGAVPSRSPLVTDPKKRVLGLVHTNLEQDVRLANEFKGYLTQYCGKNPIAVEVAYEGNDFGKAQQDNANAIVQLKLQGATTVLMLTEPIQPLFQLQQADRQDYYPEWVFSSYGYSDSNTVQRLYTSTSPDQAPAFFGLTTLGVFGGFGFGSGDPFAMYHTYHKVAPSGTPCDPSSDEGMDHDPEYCKAPTALVTWYYTFLPSIGGMLFAGPNLTPENVSKGLQAYPTTRYGGSGPTSDPRPALVGAGPGKYGFIVDSTEWRWRPEFVSPPPEEEEGFVEYPDCMRHYINWPDQLAPQWEKDGPNYNAYCGDPKTGYPRVEESDKR